MANFIEELYYGNIDPQARGYRPKSPIKNVLRMFPNAIYRFATFGSRNGLLAKRSQKTQLIILQS